MPGVAYHGWGQEDVVGPGGGSEHELDRTRDVPRFRALRRDNTSSPALRGLRMVTKALVVQWCSLSCLLEVEEGRHALSFSRYESSSNRLGTLCMGALGGLYRPPPQGYIGTLPGVGPGCQCLWPPASPPAAGARRLVGPTNCRALGRQVGPAAYGPCRLLCTIASP